MCLGGTHHVYIPHFTPPVPMPSIEDITNMPIVRGDFAPDHSQSGLAHACLIDPAISRLLGSITYN